MSTGADLKKMAQVAKALIFSMATASLDQKNGALAAIIDHLKKCQVNILKANLKDLALAKANGLDEPLLERLSLENKLNEIIDDLEKIIILPDPVGEKFDEQILPNQLHLAKYRTPIGLL